MEESPYYILSTYLRLLTEKLLYSCKNCRLAPVLVEVLVNSPVVCIESVDKNLCISLERLLCRDSIVESRSPAVRTSDVEVCLTSISLDNKSLLYNLNRNLTYHALSVNTASMYLYIA